MKITKQEALDFYNSLQILGSLTGAKFAYAVARNSNYLKPEIDALTKAYESTPEFSAYDAERLALAESHAIKGADGKGIVIDGKYELVDEVKFEKELVALKEKHNHVDQARQKQLDEFALILKEEVEVTIHTIPPEFLPKEISAGQTAGILLMIEESLKN